MPESTGVSTLPFPDGQAPRLDGARVAVVGRLWSLSRREAAAALLRAGAHLVNAPDAATVVVIGGDALTGEVAGERWPRAIDERTFCRWLGVPDFLDERAQIFGVSDLRARYPRVQATHLRQLRAGGWLRVVFENDRDAWVRFDGASLLRRVHDALGRGQSFRGVLDDLRAVRAGQLSFDFSAQVPQSRVVEMPQRGFSEASPALETGGDDRALSLAEQWFLRASLHEEEGPGAREAACEAYEVALSHDPALVPALINLANLRYESGAVDQARPLYERAAALDAESVEAHYNLGNLHADAGRVSEAERWYAAALALDPDHVDTHLRLALLWQQVGRSRAAQAHWKAYLALEPDGDWAARARAYLAQSSVD
jgi:predicted TPR repeat methyltransferase